MDVRLTIRSRIFRTQWERPSPLAAALVVLLWTDTLRRTLAICRRAIDSLVQAEGVEDVRRTYRIAKRDQADFNLACIAPDFPDAKEQMFETSYMNALFDHTGNGSFQS